MPSVHGQLLTIDNKRLHLVLPGYLRAELQIQSLPLIPKDLLTSHVNPAHPANSPLDNLHLNSRQPLQPTLKQ